MKESRKYTRLPLELAAEITLSNGKTYQGVTKNICFGGTFFEAPDLPEPKLWENCNLSVFLHEEVEKVSIDFNCEVIHVQPTGIGLKFNSINGTDAYNHLKNLMVMNSPEPDKLLKELELHPGMLLLDEQKKVDP
jgi:hypothetical protein